MLGPPDGYAAEAPSLADLDRVLGLMIAGDIAEYGAPDTDPDDILGAWRRLGFDLSADAWLVLGPDGEAAGYGEAFDRAERVDCLGVVHPDHRGRGIGSFLLSRMHARTRQWLSPDRPEVRVRLHVASVDAPGRTLVESLGYRIERRQIRMVIHLGGPLTEPTAPDGIEIRPFEPGTDARAVHALVQDAFGDIGDFVPTPFDAWWSLMMGGELFDPALWSVAAADGRVVGSISGILYPDTGWIRPLAVARTHRRRGIARALLQRTFGELQRRGATQVGLIVDADNRTGATRLYERAGMHPEREYLSYEKTIVAPGP